MSNYDTIIEGIGTLPKGTYTSILVEGIASTKEAIQFEQLQVDGTLKTNGKLEGQELHVDGVLSGEDSVEVKQLEVDGMMNLKQGHVYADEICINGVLKCEEEVSADRIEVDGLIQASLLSGDQLRLNFHDVGKMGFMTTLFVGKKFLPKIERIECTSIQASFLRCDHLCAQNITLRGHCVIDVIECDGTLSMDATCQVREIRGDYTRQEEN